METMLYKVEGEVATITLNRPESLNAGNLTWVDELLRLTEEVSGEDGVRAVVIRGAGRAFCAGIDLKVVAGRNYDFEWFGRWEQAITAFETMEKVTIAAVHGYCLGGGLQLALACDLRIGRDDVIMGLPAALEGLIPGLGGYRLARYVGLGRARRLALTGETVTAQDAFQLGLIDFMAAESAFEEVIARVTGRIVSAPLTAQLHTKKIINMAFDQAFAPVFSEYLRLQREAVDSADHLDAISRYLESKGIAR